MSWQPEVVSLAAPLRHNASSLMINVSMTTDAPLAEAARRLAPRLEELARRVESALSLQQTARGERP